MTGYMKKAVKTDAGPLDAFEQPGTGPIVIFQHGLCGDAGQPAEIFPGEHGFRHAVLNCRGHGFSPLGPKSDLSISTFTQDVAQMAMGFRQRPIAVGGISMGAAVALRLAVRRPDLVPALILSRPAWVIERAPPNMRPNSEVGAMLTEDVAAFDRTETAQNLAATAPDNLATLRGLFNRQPLSSTALLLTRISADGPGVTEAELATLCIPVLILVTDEDFIHPKDHGRRLAQMIPGAKLVKIAPKGRDRAAHITAMKLNILHFLKGLPHAAPSV